MNNDDWQPWYRQPDETDTAWTAFQTYLNGERSCEKVAKELHKTPQHIRRLAGKYDWRDRARRYDNSILEETRRELRRKLSSTFLKRWCDLDELAALAADELRAKIHSATPRTLAEILEMATEKQLATIDKLKLLEVTDDDDRKLTINIVRAGEPVDLRENSETLPA